MSASANEADCLRVEPSQVLEMRSKSFAAIRERQTLVQLIRHCHRRWRDFHSWLGEELLAMLLDLTLIALQPAFSRPAPWHHIFGLSWRALASGYEDKLQPTGGDSPFSRCLEELEPALAFILFIKFVENELRGMKCERH